MEEFIPLDAKAENVELQWDYENAQDFDKVAVGSEFFFFNRFARIEYLPLKAIDRAYAAAEGLNPAQCCNTSFDVLTLVICYGEGRAECRVPYQLQMTEILAALRKKLPKISFEIE